MAAGRPRPRAGGMLPVLPPVFALVELAIFAAAVVLEYVWPAFPDLTKLNPHPYWLPVLLISLQYGTLSGLLAAAIAILGTVLIGLPEQDIGEAYFNYLVRAWAQPVLWLVVALLLGAFRMRQIEQRDDLLGQVEELEQQSRVLDQHAEDLQARCDRLERDLATKSRPEPERLLSALARCAEGAHAPADLEAALAASLPDTAASLYTRTGNGLQLVHAHAWPAEAKWPRSISGLEPLALMVVGAGKPLSILSSSDEKTLLGHGLFAVPILDESGPVGMLKIERMPAGAIGPQTLPRLSLLAAHFARAVSALGADAASSSSVVPDRPIAVPRLARRPLRAVLSRMLSPLRAVSKDGAR